MPQLWITASAPASRSVTGGAVFGCGLVEEHGLAFDDAGQLVASFAAHVLVRSLQRKCGPLVMVEQRRPPLAHCCGIGRRA